MRKAVRITASQQMPNYRKPSSFIIKESYPLPPYSTVIGMTHSLCGWVGDNSGYRPMKISIQGKSASIVSDYATNYAFGAIPLERASFIVDNGNGSSSGVARVPRSYELLTDVELLIHILPEDEALAEEIFKAFLNPPVYPSLGRWEDLLRIDSVDIALLGEAPELVSTAFDAYVPVDSLEDNDNVVGTIYKLGKVFDFDRGNGKKPLPNSKCFRVWKQQVIVRHICPGISLETNDSILYDETRKEAVFPA